MRRYRAIAALLLPIVAAGLLLEVAVDTTDDGHGHKHRTVTIRVDGIDRDTKPDDTIVASAAAVEQYSDAIKGDLGDSGLDAGDLPKPIPGPLAAQDFPGCRTQFVRNMSSRNGAKIRLIVLHYTVSRDNGWASNNALTGMANNPANGVSWTFSIGRKTGTCAYNVPLAMKPWTQANANPYSVGIEVVAYGDEGTYVEGAGKRRLYQVVKEIAHRTGVPIQRGKVSNCYPVRPGIVRHVDLGLCGGGHHDTDPFPDPIPGMVRSLTQVTITAADGADCKRVAAYRQRRRDHKPKTAAGEARQQARLDRLRSRGLECVKGKPRRRG